MKLDFIPLDDANLAQLQQNGDRLLASDSPEVLEVKRLVMQIVDQAREFQLRVRAVPPWTGYLVVDGSEGVIVGSCGFKGNPTPDGVVEIAYGTFPPFEGRGIATQMARTLVQTALERAAVKRVLAHTLPEKNASGRVLEKAGFRRVGEVQDPEDGLVWRWEKFR